MKKVHQTTDENLQNSAGGFDCFADDQFRFSPDLDADQRAKQILARSRFFGGWSQIGGSGTGPWNLHFNEFRSQLDVEQRYEKFMELCCFLG